VAPRAEDGAPSITSSITPSIEAAGATASEAHVPHRCPTAGLDFDKWQQLWQRRRRGLVKMRIETDRQDHMRRIAELEEREAALAERGKVLERRVTELEAVQQPAAAP